MAHRAAATAGGKKYDELYGYDHLRRLRAFDRGALDGTPLDHISTPTKRQNWNLDPTGNWNGFTSIAEGTPLDGLVQQRTTNAANEITDITETVGAEWKKPVHDAAGNMTKLPQPATPTSEYDCKYDAWNRLVTVKVGATPVATYEYDGLNRRTTKLVSGTTTDFYYSDQWQVVEEQVSSAVTERFVWGLRYIDDLVLRDRISPAERLYALQDANWNVVALTNDSGVVEMRLVYDAYGTSTELSESFSTYTGTNYAWECRYTGQQLDIETGLYHFRARYYDANLGRFMSPDPMDYSSGSLSLYQYASSNPPGSVDPSGTIDLDFSGGFFDKTIRNVTVTRTFYYPIGPGGGITGKGGSRKPIDLSVPDSTKVGDFIVGDIVDAPTFSNSGMAQQTVLQRRKGRLRIYYHAVKFKITKIRYVYKVTRVQSENGKIYVCKGVVVERLAKVDTSQWMVRRYRKRYRLDSTQKQTFFDTLEPFGKFGEPDGAPEWAWWKFQGLDVLPPYNGKIPLDAFDRAVGAAKPKSRVRFRQSGRSIFRFR